MRGRVALLLALALAAAGGGTAVALLHSRSGTADVAAQRTAGGAQANGQTGGNGKHPARLLVSRAGGGLVVVTLADGGLAPLLIHDPYGTEQGRGVWSPDGRKIAFQSNAGDGSHIEVADADGSHAVDLTPTGPHVLDLQPAWSPDSSHIVYASTADTSNPAIWSISVADHTRHRLTDGKAHDVFPSWSPDGKHVAFIRTITVGKEAHAAIMVVNPDGSRLRPLISLQQAVLTTAASWSPDSTRILFSDGPTTTMQLWTVHLDGSGLTRITSDATGHYDPAWSPDGAQIAFARFTAPSPGIYVMDSGGGHPRQVTDAHTGPLPDERGRFDGSPQWEP